MTLNARPGFYQDIAREQLWLLERAGPEVAEAWRRAGLATIEFLQTHPLVGRDRKDLKHPGVRSWREPFPALADLLRRPGRRADPASRHLRHDGLAQSDFRLTHPSRHLRASVVVARDETCFAFWRNYDTNWPPRSFTSVSGRRTQSGHAPPCRQSLAERPFGETGNRQITPRGFLASSRTTELLFRP